MSNRIGVFIAGIYLLTVFGLTILPYAVNSAEAGMFVFTATQPWIILFSLLVPASLNNSELIGLLMIAVSALINAVIIYLFCALLTKALDSRKTID